jgi:xanthine dehydrogenase accessory factor
MSQDVWQCLLEAGRSGEVVALCTVTRTQGSTPRSSGARMVVRADGSIVGTVGGGALEHRVVREALDAMALRRPRSVQVHLVHDLGMCCGGATEVYVEPIEPLAHLVLFGAGHIGQLVAAQALQLGWRVTLVDARDEWNTAERFPGCERVERDPRAWLANTVLSRDVWALVVTHDHALDQDLVERLLPQRLAWLGLVGSRAKVARFCTRLRAAGMDPALFAQLRAPVGLDLGAESPAEIALSILAEMVATRRGRLGAVAPMTRTGEPVDR